MDKSVAATLYEQFFTHARHAETQRQTFFQVFVVVAGVAIGFMGSEFAASRADSVMLLFVSLFLSALAVLGLLVTFALNLAYTIFTRQAERIQVIHLDSTAAFTTFYGPTRWPKVGSRFTMLRLYAYSYCLAAAVFAAIGALALTGDRLATVSTGIVILIALAFAWERHFEPHRATYHRQYELDVAAVLASRGIGVPKEQTTLGAAAGGGPK